MGTVTRASTINVEQLAPTIADGPMTAEQAAMLKALAKAAYELDAFKPHLTGSEAEKRIAMLTAKLKLLDEPPHVL
jgi:phosphoenolpyruvate-protein kinase (PTS system EI component)